MRAVALLGVNKRRRDFLHRHVHCCNVDRRRRRFTTLHTRPVAAVKKLQSGVDAFSRSACAQQGFILHRPLSLQAQAPSGHTMSITNAARQFAKASIRGVRSCGTWTAWRLQRRPYPDAQTLRLHLGCGDVDYPGFINIDARPQAHVHHVQGIDRLDSFATGTVALVYSSHCLEHVPHRQVPDVLKEWHRVLKADGVLRLSVPDFDLLLQAYLDNDRDIQSLLKPLMGSQDYPFNFHYTCFNERELTRLLKQAGFCTVRRWAYGSDTYTSLPDWSGRSMHVAGKDYLVSLNLEAVK
jgi:predicted SAM-dependent methyltransferase